MRTSLALALLLAMPTSAFAGDFSDAFPAFPCMDGWMACLVGGQAQNPDLKPDSTGLPSPANARIGFWDLKPTAGFSPFAPLSGYDGSVGVVPPSHDDAVADAVTEGVADPEPVHPARGGTDTGAKVDPIAKVDPAVKADPQVVAKVDPAVKADPQVVAKVDPAVKADPQTLAKADPVVTTDPKGTNPDLNASLVRPKGDPGVVVPPTPATCDDLVKLEPPAMLGKLADAQVTCLEGRFAEADKPTEKDKISRILMSNAWSKGDKAAWQKLVERHLTEVDRSDPDIAYKYADYLAKKGSSKDAIKWSDVALENKQVWTGDTYVKRVSALYKIRAVSAQAMWKKAEETNATAPSDATRKDADAWRSQTKTAAREWYEYLNYAQQDSTLALQLCVAAAGTSDYCHP